MPRPRQWISYALILCLLMLATAALAVDSTAPRAFAPVQEGFTTQAEISLPYAADRILVQFRVLNMDKSGLAVGLALQTSTVGACRRPGRGTRPGSKLRRYSPV